MHEVAIASAAAGRLLELTAARVLEVGHRTELSEDGPCKWRGVAATDQQWGEAREPWGPGRVAGVRAIRLTEWWGLRARRVGRIKCG